jgi:hypothetical protein
MPRSRRRRLTGALLAALACLAIAVAGAVVAEQGRRGVPRVPRSAGARRASQEALETPPKAWALGIRR